MFARHSFLQCIRRVGIGAEDGRSQKVYSTDLVLRETGARLAQDRSASQADIESFLLRQGVGSRRAIQTSSRSAGIVATVVSRKNGTQPSLSASTPPEDATIVRPTAASDDSSAY